MKKLLFVLTALLLLPLTLTAGEKGNGFGKIVIQDSDGRTVGEVVGARHANAYVWFDFKRHSAMLFVQPHEIQISWPPGPMLFFEKADCDDSGEVYVRPELIDWGWVRPKAVVVPGPAIFPDDPSFERFVYVADAEDIAEYFPQSERSPEGYCNPVPPDPFHLWKVKQIMACKGSGGADLHWCYPPPYDMARK